MAEQDCQFVSAHPVTPGMAATFVRPHQLVVALSDVAPTRPGGESNVTALCVFICLHTWLENGHFMQNLKKHPFISVLTVKNISWLLLAFIDLH